MSDERLISTCKGNLPLSSLRYFTQWHVGDDDTIFRETYWKDLEIVRDVVHNRFKPRTTPYGSDREGAMIYTNKGNLPVKDLDYNVEWYEDDDNIIFKEFYRLNGEIVRNSVHVQAKKGMELLPKVHEFGEGEGKNQV